MALSATTQKVIKLVEEKTGLPVHVEADPSLPAATLASVKVARGATPLHSVTYQPNASTAPDYLICHECGFILRLYGAPPEQRCDLAASERGQAEVRKLVEARAQSGKVPQGAVEQLTQFLYDGLVVQLRSVPVGLRVDAWILAEFPDLAELQKQAALRQMEDAAAVLLLQARQVMPGKVVNLSLTMSAAFAQFWAERLDQPQLALPFKASGHLAAGKELLEIWRTIPDNPGEDRKLIDTWAGKLGLTGWYQWVKYSVGQ